MLAVDALLTVITGLPYSIYQFFFPRHDYGYGSRHPKMITGTVLVIIMSTNAFSTPVVYFIFNE